MDGDELFPTQEGAPQGAVLSPLLMNVALHGMETAITTTFPTRKQGRSWQPNVVRFADDFVVLHRDHDVVVQAQAIASVWLEEVGLALKSSKTKITHTLHPKEGSVGFDFLGFQVQQYPVGKYKTGTSRHGKPLGFKTRITPSAVSQHAHCQRMGHEVRRHRATSQEVLIRRLNPISQGWSNYYSAVVAKTTFTRMNTVLFAQLRRRARRRHPDKSAWWISEKYLHPHSKGMRGVIATDVNGDGEKDFIVTGPGYTIAFT